ncbi:hypothetical protein [Bdellovibrio sp. BCCA]|uniref:hypothetical protein n=1 Tax=Bdellovibrio sp. BCCA TaxID=3136281 RepID=UPI0030F2E084
MREKQRYQDKQKRLKQLEVKRQKKAVKTRRTIGGAIVEINTDPTPKRNVCGFLSKSQTVNNAEMFKYENFLKCEPSPESASQKETVPKEDNPYSYNNFVKKSS